MNATWHTITDAGYFPGAAALVNSMRLTGNEDEVVVLDRGLRPDQRARLEPHCRVIELDPTLAERTMQWKAYPALLEPEGVIGIIDSDVIVTGDLSPLVRSAAEGHVVAFPDVDDDRLLPEWERVLGLSAPPRRQPYVNAGTLVLDAGRWGDLLRRWWDLCARIPEGSMRVEGAPYESPFWDGDQDILNALLMSEVDEGTVAARIPEEGPLLDGLRRTRLLDAATLRCECDGRPVAVLHYVGNPKPWQPRAWRRVRRDAYTRLLSRVLLADDVPVRVEPAEIPVWLRDGVAGRGASHGLSAVNTGARHARALVRRIRR